jgi:hypothetical protein
MIIYLYKKTHNKTGFKYLGKTTSKDPHKYQGSGHIWKKHLRKHGYDVTTEILKECNTKEEIRHWGKHYSNLWSVVESPDWANMRPEEGDGGATTFGEGHPMKNPVHRNKISGDNHYSKKDGYEWKLIGTRHPMKNSENCKKLQGDNHYSKNPNFTGQLFGDRNSAFTPESLAKRSGSNHYTKKEGYISRNPKEAYNYNHTVYAWENINTGQVVNATRHDFIHQYLNGCSNNISNLINNKRNVKTVKGWKVKNT